MSTLYRIQVNTQFIDKSTGDVIRAGSLFRTTDYGEVIKRLEDE